MNQQCNLTPTSLTTIEDITLQDYIDISAYNTANSVSYTEAQYKQTAQTLLTDILAGSGAISITVASLDDRFLKMQDSEDVITYLEEEALPDIQGTFRMPEAGSTSYFGFDNTFGAFDTDISGQMKSENGTGSVNRNTRLWFKASKYNAIYGRSGHVRPNNVHLRPFIKY